MIHEIDDVIVCQICAGWGSLKTLDMNENETEVTCSSCLGDGYSKPKLRFVSHQKPSSKNKVIELVLKVLAQKESKIC